jgi:hypothetical protein
MKTPQSDRFETRVPVCAALLFTLRKMRPEPTGYQ